MADNTPTLSIFGVYLYMALGKPTTCLIGSLLLFCGASAVHSQITPLRVKITVPKTTVRNGEKLYIATAIVNTSTTEQMLVVMACPEWTSDSTVVRVDAPSCMKNVPRKIPLKPGEEFTSVVHTHLEIPNSKSNTDKVTFRLGYRVPTFFGNEANPKVQPLWSNAVSISVTQ